MIKSVELTDGIRKRYFGEIRQGNLTEVNIVLVYRLFAFLAHLFLHLSDACHYQMLFLHVIGVV